jgi:hypothetical protein
MLRTSTIFWSMPAGITSTRRARSTGNTVNHKPPTIALDLGDGHIDVTRRL